MFLVRARQRQAIIDAVRELEHAHDAAAADPPNPEQIAAVVLEALDRLDLASSRLPADHPLERLRQIRDGLDRLQDQVRLLEASLPGDLIEHPAFTTCAQLIGALQVAETHVIARVVPAWASLDPYQGADDPHDESLSARRRRAARFN